MSTPAPNRVRRSVNDLWKDYAKGLTTDTPEGAALKKPLEDVVRAWQWICDPEKNAPDDFNSFFKIGGMHGAPFRGAGYANYAWWGGYCNHGNVSFPTWHRAYLLRLENALRSAPGCEDVTLPYWDETGADTASNGVPGIFLLETFKLDGKDIPNPLYSYKFPQNIIDRADVDKDGQQSNVYTKFKDYQTVRYPYSGLMGTKEFQESSNIHNETIRKMPDKGAALLNSNVKNWLDDTALIDGKPFQKMGTRKKYETCLDAPNYTVFSNTTSAQAWNDVHELAEHAISLEDPHNDIHLATGGYDLPTDPNKRSPYAGANGDMGENDTAGLDPLFYFHHACVDRYFWLWQKSKEATKEFDIIDEYPGTNSVDSQGPTPGVAGGVWLTMDSDLQPFRRNQILPHSQDTSFCTSKDMIDIETQLDYTYAEPRSDGLVYAPGPLETPNAAVRIAGVNKNLISGSHIIATYASFPDIDGGEQKHLYAVQSVLSRWSTNGCANCQTQQSVARHVPLHGLAAEDLESKKVVLHVNVITRGGDGNKNWLGDSSNGPNKDVSFEVVNEKGDTVTTVTAS